VRKWRVRQKVAERHVPNPRRDKVCNEESVQSARTTASTHKLTHRATLNKEFLLQRAQTDRQVCWQSLQVVAVKVELPVGEEGDTRSGSHPSVPAHERMRMSSSKWWKRTGERQSKELLRRKSGKLFSQSQKKQNR
jgi:hypothetical protein